MDQCMQATPERQPPRVNLDVNVEQLCLRSNSLTALIDLTSKETDDTVMLALCDAMRLVHAESDRLLTQIYEEVCIAGLTASSLSFGPSVGRH